MCIRDRDTYRTQSRGGKGVTGHTTRDEDFVKDIFVTSTHSHILFFTNTGRAFRIKCYVIPEAGRQAKGTAIVNLLQLKNGEKVAAAFPVNDYTNGGKYLVMATKQGVIKKTALKDFDNINKGGIIALGLREGDELIGVQLTGGNDDIMIGTANGMSIRFHEDDVRPMGRTATGVRAIKLDEGDEVIDMTKIEPGCYVLAITERGLGKRTEEAEYGTQSRGGKGVKTLKLTEKTGRLVCLRLCTDEEDIMLVRDDGVIIRVPAKDISVISRNTQGVRLMRVDDEHRVVSIARAPHNEEEAFEKAAQEHLSLIHI